MKKVVLQSLTLHNFRGEKDRTTNFNEVETTISGDNGLGKSRHFDAFVWLLFGKDTQDRKDFNIKTLVKGISLSKVDCEVIGVLNVDSETITLRRVYKEKWVKPRGQAQERFDGHEHSLFWNDVPLKVGEYQSRINSIINDDVFKMITNPMFFAGMDWKKQREQLFQLAGTITDHEIVAQKPEYKELLDKLTGKSFEDFKREISARKRKLKEELEQIQPRIDQTQKLMPESTDFAALEAEIKKLEKEIKDIDDAIADKSTATKQQSEARQKKQNEINELKQKQQQVVFDAKTNAKEVAFEANALRRNLQDNIKTVENEISLLERAVRNSENELNNTKDHLSGKETAIEAKRQEWHAENATEYKGDDTCQTCGQILPEETRANARQLFADAKEKKLAEITQNGKDMGAELEQMRRDITNTENSLKTSKNELKTKQNELATLQGQLEEMPATEAQEIVANELPEWITLENKIKKIEASIEPTEQSIDTTGLQTQKKELSDKRDVAKTEFGKRDLITKYQGEIQDLEKKGKDLAQQIADVEREEYTIQNFTKARIDECERRINGLFSHVTFKLFEYTIDGNEVETCIPLVNGIPFGVANSAGQVNAGLDIINALVQFYGVSAPIFIDGRESVNRLIQTESQIINLVVTTDKELVIK